MKNLWKSFVLLLAIVALSFSVSQAQQSSLRFFSSGGTPRNLRIMKFSPSCKLLAVSVDRKLLLVRPSDGKILFEHPGAPFELSFSPDDRQLLTLSENQTQIINTQDYTVTKLRTKLPPGYLGFSLEINGGKLLIKSIHPDGPAAISKNLHVGDELVGIAQEQRSESLLGHSVQDAIKKLAGPMGTEAELEITPAGQRRKTTVHLRRQRREQVEGEYRFASPGDATLARNMSIAVVREHFALFDPTTGDIMSAITQDGLARSGPQAVSPDGRYFARVAKKKTNGDIYVGLYDVQRQERILLKKLFGNGAFSAQFTSDSQQLVIGSETTIEVLDVHKKHFLAPIKLVELPKLAKKKNPEYNRSSANILGSVAAEVGPFGSSSPSRRVLSKLALGPPDLVAVGTLKGKISIWSLSSHERLHDLPDTPSSKIEAIEYSSDGKWIAYYAKGTLYIDAVEALPDVVQPVPPQSVSADNDSNG